MPLAIGEGKYSDEPCMSKEVVIFEMRVKSQVRIRLKRRATIFSLVKTGASAFISSVS